MPLDYRQVATFLGHPSNGSIAGMDVLTLVRDPTFPGVAWDAHAYEWATGDILTWSGMEAPTLTSLVPTSAEIGDPSFTLHAHGTGFTASSVILWNGAPELTIVVSPTELTTVVNMLTATTPASIPVAVQTGGVHVTAPLPFDLQPAA
jgi:hypothetical protein